MSREIKFRAIYKGHFVFGNLIIGEHNGVEFCEIEQSLSYDFQKWTVDKESVGQFTGLKDKNGKEIYEWDVLTGSGKPPIIIRFEHQAFRRFQIGYDYQYRASALTIDDVDDHDLEIIGNIHQNPELLKGANHG